MKEFVDFKIIGNKRYSPKEALAFFIMSSENTFETNIEVIERKCEELIQKNRDNKNILEKVEIKQLEKIINYWSLSFKQIKAYTYIVFKNLILENKIFSQNNITDMFVYVMRLYSPDNAEEYVEKEKKK